MRAPSCANAPSQVTSLLYYKEGGSASIFSVHRWQGFDDGGNKLRKLALNQWTNGLPSTKIDSMMTRKERETTDTTGKPKRKKRRGLRIALILLVLLLVLYVALCNVLVSACLVPSFMEKLDAFQSITEEEYSRQTASEEITQAREASRAIVQAWFEEADKEKLHITSADGYDLVAMEFLAPPVSVTTGQPVSQEEAPVSHLWVICLHGYTGCKEEVYAFACWYNMLGANVLVPDLRCQGESEGDFIGMGWTDREDVRLWIDQILAQDPQAQIVLHGQSMGAACALLVSGMEDLPDNVKCVISDCSYTGAYEMFEYKIHDWFGLPAFPLVDSANWFLQLRGGYDLRDASPLEAVQHSRVPTLFIHGDADGTIPVSMAQELYDAAACEKQLLIVPGAGHAQSQDVDPETYYLTVFDWVNNHLS